MKHKNINEQNSDNLYKEDKLAQEEDLKQQEEGFKDNMSEEELPQNSEEMNIDEEEDKTLEDKYEELNDSYLRLHAEYDNYRKRTLKEKMEIIKTGGEKVLTEMITLVDDFERALETIEKADDKEAIVEGLELIYAKFINFINQHGVKEIEAIGEPFDSDKFEAITTIPVQDKSQKDKVVDCVQKGYVLHDKVIRFPKVIVGK